MTTDQLEAQLRSEFHRLDQRMMEEGNLHLPSYVASRPAHSHRWVRVVAVASVAAAVVLLIPILKPSDKPRTTRVADAQLILPGETPYEAAERIDRACMIEGGFTPIDGGSSSVEGVRPFAIAGYIPSQEMADRKLICAKRIEELGIFPTPPQPTADQWTVFYPHAVALVDCLSAKGFDLGTITSLEEYVSSGGDTLVSPKLADLESADKTDPKYLECVQKEILLYTSILRT